jgi:MGS-like domain
VRALISVYEKDGIADFARGLSELGFELVSSGGTAAALEEAGLKVTRVEDLTGFPEMLDGRVKTLHPRVHAGILARRERSDDLAALAQQGIEPFELVCVNLYPFELAVDRPELDEAGLIEMIDVGGPALMRAAAKNFASVTVVVRPQDYDAVLDELREGGGTGCGDVWRHPRSPARRGTRPRSRAGSSVGWTSRRRSSQRSTACASCRTGRTHTRERPTTPSGAHARTSSHSWNSCGGRSCRSTTSATSRPRGSSCRSSTGRRA